MQTLVAGPWLGEFGWELFMWQAHIRFLAHKYSQIVILCRTGHEFLYNDFATECVFVDQEGPRNGWRLNELQPFIPLDVKKYLEGAYKNIDYIIPGQQFDFKDQEFIRFVAESDKQYDLLFHCRSTDKLGTAKRNWPVEKWQELQNHFKNRRIACIGSKIESLNIEGVEDLRGISLKNLVGVLNNTKLLIGPSSGPMHLAALCGCSQIIFTDKSLAFEGKYTNRYRYEQGWNPFKTKSIILDAEGWNPSLETVIKFIEQEFNENFNGGSF
ncbi:MAG: glycosyltransferase family 9 protein [Bacteroidales bacterium]|jgi:ADP-heptose:LPS heptosyltransferase